MPSSDPCNIGRLLQMVRDLSPLNILDVGIGCGKFGMLFREYLDGHWVGRAFHSPETWRIRMIGLEIFPSYITPVHQYLYDDIIIMDAYKYFTDPGKDKFDLIFMGDIIEHWEKEDGFTILRYIQQDWLTRGGAVIISTPNFRTRINDERIGEKVFGNKHEVHRCQWTAKDFEGLEGFEISIHANRMLAVQLIKE